MPERILVCVAWPYANYLLHVGQAAGAYLPADIFARYQRLRGADVVMVSGSDSHGTPITVSADQEGVEPRDIVDRYHPKIEETWERLGISFDLYTTTLTENHHEVTQEIFLRIYQGLPGFSLRCRFTTWLFQIAKNRVLDELRARERKPQAVVNIDDVPPLEVVDTPPERTEVIDAVWRAVGLLNPDLKMALLLRDVVGLSYTEIADSLEITLATVKWRIFKAREEVQLALERDGIEVEVSRQPLAHGK